MLARNLKCLLFHLPPNNSNWCRRLQTTQPDSPQLPDAVIPLDKPVTARRSRKTQRDVSDAIHVQTSARHRTTTTQQMQTANESREGDTCRTATQQSRHTDARFAGASIASEGGDATTLHEQLDVSRDSTTAAPQTPAHRHRCCATTAADSRSDRQMKRSATHIATQQHSNTAIHDQRTQPETHTQHKQTSNHRAEAAQTTTLHTQHARQHSSNTQSRRRGSAHPPATAISSIERSHSACTTIVPVSQSL